LGQRVRFTRPDTWLAAAGYPLGPPANPQAATAAVTRRFLAAYGPATYHDLARWWNGGGVSTARQWIASLGAESPVELDGAQAWMLTADAREARELPPDWSVRLLPGFDQYVVGRILPRRAPRRSEYISNGWKSGKPSRGSNFSNFTPD
jgi:winged helix DNA-binding protein